MSRWNAQVHTSWPTSPTTTTAGIQHRALDARTLAVPNGKASNLNLNRLLPGSITRKR